MHRQNDPVLHHVDRSFWEYADKMDDGRMGCKFCGHFYGKDTSISKIKFHLAGVKDRGVRICGQVPQDVQNAALAAVPIDGPLEKKLKTRAGPSNKKGQRRKRIEMARLKSGWTLLMTNLIIEIASAVFDQLGYALVGMVLAFVALLLSTAELIHMARRERMSVLPISRGKSTATLAPGKPVGTIVEYFGLVGAVWQCCYSTVEYAYARQKKDNPIKMCILPFIFLLCVVISKLIKKSYIDKSA